MTRIAAEERGMATPKGDIFDIDYLNRNRRDRVRFWIFIGSEVASYVSSIFIIAALPEFLSWQLTIPAVIAVLILTWYLMPKLIFTVHRHMLNKAVYVYKNAHERFDKVTPEDPDVMDEWYHEGALVLWSSEDKAFDLFYNWLRDAGIIDSERVTVYEVSREFFLTKYPYVDDRHWKPFPDTVWVFPLSATLKRGAKKEVRRLMLYDYNYMIFIDWFAFAVNGTRNDKEYGFIHDYKDLIEDFEEL